MNPTTTTTPNSSLLMSSLMLVGGLTLALMLLLARPGSNAVAPSPMMVLDEAAVKAGRTTFLTVCAACHGTQGMGIQGLGKPLVGSAFFSSLTNAELLTFLQNGRPVNDPLNTTGVPMPARGGRLGLTDADLANVIAYIRSLNMAAPPVVVKK
jgi:mono/diheme cytochrome c family protein